MLSMNTLTLTLLVGTVIPLLVAVVTKANASPGVKAFVNVVLTAAAGAATALLASNGGLPWQQVVIAAFATYVASGTSYNHLWKPTGVAPSIASAFPQLGLGGPKAP